MKSSIHFLNQSVLHFQPGVEQHRLLWDPKLLFFLDFLLFIFSQSKLNPTKPLFFWLFLLPQPDDLLFFVVHLNIFVNLVTK